MARFAKVMAYFIVACQQLSFFNAAFLLPAFRFFPSTLASGQPSVVIVGVEVVWLHSIDASTAWKIRAAYSNRNCSIPYLQPGGFTPIDSAVTAATAISQWSTVKQPKWVHSVVKDWVQ